MTAEIFVVVKDRAGKEARFSVPYASADLNTLVKAQAAGEVIVVAADALIKGQIINMGVSFDLSLTAILGSIKAVPDILADVRDKARFGFLSTGAAGEFPKTLTLPTYDEDLTVDGTNNVDLTDADVDAFVDGMINGFGLIAPPEPTDSREYDIIALDYAIELD